MNHAQYIEERDRYFGVALPSREDFSRYTAAFFNWVDDVTDRLRRKHPGLFPKPADPLPLFDGAER